MATYTLSPNVKRQLLDNSGNPLNGGKLYTVSAGGVYPADAITTYQTSSGTAHANPIVLDSAGRVSGSSEIYLSPGVSYKFILKTSADVEVWTQDNIAAVPGSASALDFTITLGVDVDAGECLYLSDGTAIAAGTWGKADADFTYTSTTPQLAFAITAGLAGTQIQARQGGMVEVTPLTPGVKYYVSSTAGAITSVAPTVNARYVGQAVSSSLLLISNEIADSPTNGVVIDPRVKDICDFRLSLTTNVPVPTGDVTAATTVYWTPYRGNNVALYSGARWVNFASAQLSLGVPATTSQMYDVFVDYNSGSPALAVIAWTNDTTRATALTTQDGILVATGNTSRRYVGSFRTTGVSGQTEDSLTNRLLWNFYNRVPRALEMKSATASWTYSNQTIRQANGSAGNQVAAVIGVAEVIVDLDLNVIVAGDTIGQRGFSGIGIDSTTTFSGIYGLMTSNPVNVQLPIWASIKSQPAAGYHVFSWNESNDAGGTFTYYGVSATGTNRVQSGLTGWVQG